MKKKQNIIVTSLLTLGLLSVGSIGHAQELKVAFLDAQKVLTSAKEGNRIRQGLDEFVKTRQGVIDLDEKELKRMKDELDSQGILLSKEALQMKQNEMENAINQYRKKVNELQKEVQDKRMSALGVFNDKLELSVKEIAEKEGYSFVLDKNSDRGAVLYSKEGYDITARVIEQMDKQFAIKEAPKKEKK